MANNNKTTINCMIRDEPLIYFALYYPCMYADRVIIWDTGSEDDTLEDIYSLKKIYPHIEIYESKLESAHNWSLNRMNEFGTGPSYNEIGDIRRKMHEMTDTDLIWLIDGDELYSNYMAQETHRFARSLPANVCCGFLTFWDLIYNFKYSHQHHMMGRIFRQKDIEILHGYPGEMHVSKHLKGDLYPSRSDCTVSGATVMHAEMLLRPWRRSTYDNVIELNYDTNTIFHVNVDLFEKRWLSIKDKLEKYYDEHPTEFKLAVPKQTFYKK